MPILKFHTSVRLIAIVLLPIMWLYPSLSAFAETLPADSTTSTNSTTNNSTSTTNTGPTKPTGDASKTYTYNKDTGLWENAHYTWDPTTNQTAPKVKPNYSYNPETNMWDTTEWRYDAPTGDYVPNKTSVSTVPQTPTSGETTDNSPTKNSLSADPSKINSPVNASSNSNGIYDLFYNAQISNVVNSTATSGSASVTQNTLAGSALSGDAQAMANIINLLQSSWGSATGGQVTTFINNIEGNVFGDLVIDPGQISSSSLSSSQNQPNTNLNLNVQNNGSINNQINLAANSGAANVDKNTSVGNATTGTADAVANVVNMINSTISSGNSFIGMINIDGNLNGDILLPDEMINQLLASNSVPKATIDTSKLANGSLLANYTNNATINNNLTTDAGSGKATVANNTSAGNATTGDASTNITILNLTGQQIIGDNCLLVFVNVLGKWVGMIVNAPSGSTSAALGSGISKNESASANAEINAQNNSTINNNIITSAHSGDASVTNNTEAGNATSGDASASVNLLNMIDSQLSLSKWFGILFINVFGSWQGSFGIDTSAGERASLPNSKVSSSHSGGGMQVFRFVPSSNGGTAIAQTFGTSMGTSSSGGDNSNEHQQSAVLASSNSNSRGQPQEIISKSVSAGVNSAWIVAGASIFLGLGMLGTEQILSRRSLIK